MSGTAQPLDSDSWWARFTDHSARPESGSDGPHADDVRVKGAITTIPIPAGGMALRDIEREALELTMRLTGFNQSAAARILRISRPTLARKLRAHGIKR